MRFYLLGREFIIETDHSALTASLNDKHGNIKILRWSLLLQEYTFVIINISKKLKTVADAN